MNPESLDITPSKHPQQFSLPSTSFTLVVIEALNATNQPTCLRDGHAAIRHHLAMHEDETLLIREVEVVRDGGMRLGEFPVKLVRGKMRKHDR